MSSRLEGVKEVLYVLLGGVLYAGLNLIPVLGPLTVGAMIGAASRGGLRRGFKLGVASGVLGCIFFGIGLLRLDFLGATGLGAAAIILLAWVLLFWNVVGVLSCGLGAAAGVMLKEFSQTYDSFLRRGSKSRGEPVVYRICPVCNEGTADEKGFCVKCGNAAA